MVTTETRSERPFEINGILIAFGILIRSIGFDVRQDHDKGAQRFKVLPNLPASIRPFEGIPDFGPKASARAILGRERCRPRSSARLLPWHHRRKRIWEEHTPSDDRRRCSA